MGTRFIKIIVFLFFALLLILPFSQKTLAVAIITNPSRIIITPPREKADGTMLVKLGENNTLRFGICGNDSNPDKLNAVLSATEGGTVSPNQSGLLPKYSAERGTGEKCKDGLFIYGPKTEFKYEPPAVPNDTKKNLIIKYFAENSGEDPFIDVQFTVQIVDQWPADATEPEGSWTPPDLGKFGNMLNINDIFDRIQTNTDIESPQGIVQKILTILLEISAVLALLAFVWSGFQFVTSSGEPGQVEKAKKAMIGAFIGILIIIFAYSIIRAVDIFSSPPKEDSFEEVKFD